MRRTLMVLLVGLAMVFTVPQASDASARGSSPLDLQAARRLNFFYFGSGANPLLNGTCGRVVGGTYLLPAATAPGSELTCHVPAGTPLLGSPGGAIAWSPTDGSTASELFATRDELFADLCCPKAVVDGRRLSVFEVSSYAYVMKLQPGNLIQAVDSAVTGDSTLVAARDWLVSVPPLSPGRHTVVTSDRVGGTFTDITLHLIVS